MKVLLGIDIGTSACKIAFFKTDGTPVAMGTGEYPVYYKRTGWAEQDPDEWWAAVSQTIRKIIKEKQIVPEDVAGIGIGGQSWSAVAVDREGRVLTNTPIWLDTRSNQICSRLKDRYGQDLFVERSGNPLQSFYTTGKILWYKEEMPEVYDNIHKILQSNTFIAYRLTGAMVQDLSQSYGLHCFDMEKGRWDEEMCAKIGIPMDFLPELVMCHQVMGTVTREAAKLTGLAVGTPVVAGGLDAACGALGAGVLKAGDTQEQGGQAGGMSICIDEYIADPRLILSCHVVPGKWLLQGGSTGGGGVMRWLDQEFGDYERMQKPQLGKSSMAQLDEQAQQIPAGSEGVVFLPYMAGERSPIWDEHAKGVFYGLDFSKTKAHFVRAALEGVAYSLQHNLEIAKSRGAKVAQLRAIGGAANSRLWTQIKADVTGKLVAVPSSDTATTLGAAILAGVGTGVYADFTEAVEKTVKITRIHEPDMEKHKIYQAVYPVYLELYDRLKELMKKSGGEQ